MKSTEKRADRIDATELSGGRAERLKAIFAHNYENSVFRRTGVLLGFLLPASLANFAVLYFMTAVLTPTQFGIFYVANTFGNVLFSGSLILNMFFARHFVTVAQERGADAALATATLVGRIVSGWGALMALVVLSAMLFFSHQFGVQSLAIIPLITLDAYTSYVADIGRAFYQSQRRTVLLGVYTLAWMTFRLIFCLIGVFLFRNAFGALLGIVLSAVMAFATFRLWAARRSNRNVEASPLPSLNALLPSVLGYGLLITISNLDILLTYFILKDATLGIYSASSIYPKAMMVVTLPLVQILFPGMMGSKSADDESRRFVYKSAAAMVAVTTGGIFGIWLLSGFLCGGRWGVKLCDPLLLYALLLSVVPLALLRVLVLLQFARRRDWLASWLIIPTAAYLWLAITSHWDAHALAIGFSMFSFVSFVFFLGMHFVAERLTVTGR